MTGSCSLWLLLGALLPLIRVDPVCCQQVVIVKEDHRVTVVLAIKNNESGLQLEIYPEPPCLSVLDNSGSIVNDSGASDSPNLELEPQIIHFIPGHNLSLECGNQYFRCQQLSTENLSLQDNGGEFTIVFIPLENGLLLLSYWYNYRRPMMMKWSTFIVNSSNCSPTVFYNFNNKIYSVCVSSYRYVSVYEVRLNLSDSVIRGAALIGPLTSISISDSYISLNVSNFIVVDNRIFFAIGNTIIVMDIFDTTQTRQYPDLPQCTQIHKLVPIIGAGNQQMLIAYCTDRYSNFDLVYGDWSSTQLFSSSGIPYICPDSSYKVRLFQGGILQFSVRYSSVNMIKNVNISSGVCFNSQNKPYFAYSDQQRNSVFVYDFITQNHYPIAPYDCPHQNCPQLLLFIYNQYLVIRDDIHDLVLDTTTNFSLIINISSGVADILTVLRINTYCAITPSTILIHSTSPAQFISTSINHGTTSTPINCLDHSSAITPSPPFIMTISTQAPSTINWGNVTTPTPLISLSSTITTTVSLSTDVTKYSPYSTTNTRTVTSTHTDPPTMPADVNNSVGKTWTVIGLFAFIIILTMVAVGLSIRYLRRKWHNNMYRAPRIGYVTDQTPAIPLLAAGSYSFREEEEKEEESESYEMESMANLREPQKCDKGWRWTTTL